MSAQTGHPRWRVTLDDALLAFAELEQPRGPTARELLQALGLKSYSSIDHWTRRLREGGLIEEIPSRSSAAARKYRLTAKGRAASAREEVPA